MRIYPGTTVDYEFATLGGLGYTGTLNDRQFAALRAEGLTGSLPDMFKQFDGTLGGSLTLSQQVEAILSGTSGFALDPSDTSTMHQDTARTIPVVSASDPVGNIRSKWGTTTYDWQQATAAARPAWNGTAGLTFDGVDDHLLTFSDLTIAAGKDDILISLGAKVTSFVGTRALYNIGSTTLTAGRIACFVPDTGAVQVFARRNTESGTFCNSAGSALTAATKAVLTQKYKFTGSPTINSRKDGTQIANTDPFGSSAVTGGNSGRITLGLNVDLTNPLLGSIGRFVYCPFAVTDPQRLVIEAWIGETTL